MLPTDRNFFLIGSCFENSKENVDYKILGQSLEGQSLTFRVARFLSQFTSFSLINDHYVGQVKALVREFSIAYVNEANKASKKNICPELLAEDPAFNTLSYHKVKDLIVRDMNVSKVLNEISEKEKCTAYEKALVKEKFFSSNAKIPTHEIGKELQRIYSSFNLRNSLTLDFKGQSNEVVLEQLAVSRKDLKELTLTDCQLDIHQINEIIDQFTSLKKLHVPRDWLKNGEKEKIQEAIDLFFIRAFSKLNIEELNIPKLSQSVSVNFNIKDMGSLTSLKKLELGELCQSHLGVIANLKKLESLTIHQDIEFFVEDLNKLKVLRHLHTLVIHSNNNRGRFELLGKKLVKLKSLQHLSIQTNRVMGIPPRNENDTDENIASFFYNLSRLKKLETLDLSLGSDVFFLGYLVQNLCRFPALKSVDFSHNKLTIEENPKLFAHDVTCALKLEKINLSNNSFDMKPLIVFIKLFKNMPGLKELDLTEWALECQDRAAMLKAFQDRAAMLKALQDRAAMLMALTENLEYVPLLNKLCLSWLLLDDWAAVNRFANTLGGLTHLETVNLMSCKWTAQTLEIIVHALSELPNLQKITLNTEHLLAPSSPKSLAALASLEKLKKTVAERAKLTV